MNLKHKNIFQEINISKQKHPSSLNTISKAKEETV